MDAGVELPGDPDCTKHFADGATIHRLPLPTAADLKEKLDPRLTAHAVQPIVRARSTPVELVPASRREVMPKRVPEQPGTR